MKNKLFVFSSVFLVVLLAGFVTAAGIVSPYWKDYPLRMNYGETKTINFNLQNMVGSDDITVEVEITQGLDIATLERTTYTAKIGTSDTQIPLRITIPENYNKQFQKIELEIKTVVSDQRGMITLSTGWRPSFNVILSETPIPRTSLVGIIISLIIIVIILILIISLLLARSPKRTRRKRR